MSAIHDAVWNNDIQELTRLLDNGGDPNEKYHDEWATSRQIAGTIAQVPTKVVGGTLAAIGGFFAFIEPFARLGHTALLINSERNQSNQSSLSSASNFSELRNLQESQSRWDRYNSQWAHRREALAEGRNTFDDYTAPGKWIFSVGDTTFSEIRANKDGWTPLHFAAIRSNLAAVKILLQRGARVYEESTSQETPLALALVWGKKEFYKILLEEIIRLNTTDRHGDTPLHQCIKFNEIELAGKCILNGSDFQVRNVAGQSALSLAITRQQVVPCALMLHKAPTIANLFGHTSENFRTQVRNCCDEIAGINMQFQRSLTTILADVTTPTGDVRYNRTDLESVYNDLMAIPDLLPILEIAKLAALALHDFAKMQDPTRVSGLKIRIDHHNETLESMTLNTCRGAVGVHFTGINSIYVAGIRTSPILVRGTLIHELTHFVANEVYKNNCKPYSVDNHAAQQLFENITNDIGRRIIGAAVHEKFRQLVTYERLYWPRELIVRAAQIITEQGQQQGVMTLQQQAPELLNYFQNNFLQDCRKHIEKLKLKNLVFTSNVIPIQSVRPNMENDTAEESTSNMPRYN